MSYEPTQKVKDDSRYKTVLNLADGDYSLYYFWDNNTLHQFIDKTGCEFDEYKNY